MTLLKEISLISKQISDKSKSAVIFDQKCHIVSGILRDIDDVLCYDPPDEEVHKKSLLKLKKILSKILTTVDSLQDKEKLIIFMYKGQSIQQIIQDINSSMKKVNSLMNDIGIKGNFNLPNDDLYDDYDKIDNLLMDVLGRFQKRRNEVGECLKQSQTTSINENYASSNIDELNKYPQYKLKRSDFEYNPQVKVDFNNVFDYYDGTMKGQKVTVMKLKDNSIFKRLLNVLVTIDHPYIEKFIGAYIEGSKILLITDRNGSNLANVFDDKDNLTLKLGDMTILAFKIAQAMSYLHSRSVVHRNLTPLNVFVNRQNGEISPKIVGFRNSRLIPGENSLGMSSLSINSKVPISYFTAPEIDDGQYNEKVDVFAFSGILYQMLTGHIPFPKKAKSEVLNLLSGGERPELPEEGLSKELKELIESCWSQHPHNRLSFDQIVIKMVKEKIVFPCDEKAREKILAFYEKCEIKSDYTLQCLNAFDTIRNYIGKTLQYRFEFLRARPILSSYRYKLKESSYSTKNKLSKTKIDKLKALYDNLINFQTVTLNNSEEKWREVYDEVSRMISESNRQKKSLNSRNKKQHRFPDIKVIEPISQITNSMDSIYKSMVDLGFTDIEKYVESDDDLVFDLRELSTYFPQIKIEYFNDRADQIDAFREKRNLNEQVSDQATHRRLKDLFSQFKQFELNLSDFNDTEIDEKNCYDEGAESKVYIKKYKDETVAVKVLTDYLNSGETELSFLRREIDYLTRLKHPYISEFIGFSLFDDQNIVWLVSKYIKDGTLEELINERKLDGNDKTKIAFKIAQAMEFIHSKNIIHLDLKPGNILMDGKIPKIIDFGYSSPNNVALINKLGVGTLNFMAPEVFKKEEYSSAADVFSFSMLLYNLYADEVPYRKKKRTEIEKILREGNHEDLLKFGDDVSKGLKELIVETRNVDQSKRPSFEEIIYQMVNNNIMFPGANDAEIRKFYDEESNKMKESQIKVKFT